MVELGKVESIIWEIIDTRHEGKPNAISQQKLLDEVQFFDLFHAPKSLRGLRAIMRGLKMKRPILESFKGEPGYHKPADWGEINSCLGLRKIRAAREFILTNEMLKVCKEFIPQKTGKQLKLFSQKTINSFPELSYKE